VTLYYETRCEECGKTHPNLHQVVRETASGVNVLLDCPGDGGSRREVTVDALQDALDMVVDNLLPEGQGMVIDMEALLEAALREETK
jgi:hypothetical protein